MNKQIHYITNKFVGLNPPELSCHPHIFLLNIDSFPILGKNRPIKFHQNQSVSDKLTTEFDICNRWMGYFRNYFRDCLLLGGYGFVGRVIMSCTVTVSGLHTRVTQHCINLYITETFCDPHPHQNSFIWLEIFGKMIFQANFFKMLNFAFSYQHKIMPLNGTSYPVNEKFFGYAHFVTIIQKKCWNLKCLNY